MHIKCTLLEPGIPKDMTKEDLITKYKKHQFIFYRYYKYTFYFMNEAAMLQVGGSGDDIYRSTISPVMTLDEIIFECGDQYLAISEITIINHD